MLNLY